MPHPYNRGVPARQSRDYPSAGIISSRRECPMRLGRCHRLLHAGLVSGEPAARSRGPASTVLIDQKGGVHRGLAGRVLTRAELGSLTRELHRTPAGRGPLRRQYGDALSFYIAEDWSESVG